MRTRVPSARAVPMMPSNALDLLDLDADIDEEIDAVASVLAPVEVVPEVTITKKAKVERIDVLGYDLEPEEREKLLDLASNGGTIHVGIDDDGSYAIVEGTPHVEASIDGCDIPKVLRALADMIESASR